MKILYRLLLLQLTGGFLLLSPLQASPQAEQDDGRARSGLQVLYDFSLSSGPVVKDRSGAGKPINLTIVGINSVRRSSGSLEVRSTTLVRSGKEAARLVDGERERPDVVT